MLPDFPRIKQKIEKLFIQAIKEEIRKDPILQGIKEVPQFEGDTIVTGTTEGEVFESTYSRNNAKFAPSREEIIEKGYGAFSDLIPDIAERFIKQRWDLLRDGIELATARAGTNINAKGRGFSFDLFMEALGSMDWHFDSQGNFVPPQLVVGPKLYKQSQSQFEEWERNPEYKKRFEELRDRKRREWDDRESNRKLVD